RLILRAALLTSATKLSGTKPESGRRQLEARMELPLAIVLNSLDDAVLCLDERATVLWLNEAAARLVGGEPGLLVGHPASSAPHLAEVVNQSSRAELARSESARAIRRVRLPCPGGEPAALEAAVTRLEHERQRLFTVVFRDVGLLLQMEQAVYESR